MGGVIQFLLRHGYAVLFAFVLAEQIGLLLPAVPVLLAVGALAGTGQLSFPAALLVAPAAGARLEGPLGWTIKSEFSLPEEGSRSEYLPRKKILRPPPACRSGRQGGADEESHWLPTP